MPGRGIKEELLWKKRPDSIKRIELVDETIREPDDGATAPEKSEEPQK